MKVKEAIEQLQKFDGELDIYGCEQGELSEPWIIPAKLNVLSGTRFFDEDLVETADCVVFWYDGETEV